MGHAHAQLGEVPAVGGLQRAHAAHRRGAAQGAADVAADAQGGGP